MIQKIENYLKILYLELEDLEMDIELLISECKKEREEDIITNYVFLENLSLLKNELLGLKDFRIIVDEVKPGEYENLEALVDHLRNSFKKKIEDHALSKAIVLYINRKLEKVAKYVQ